MPSSGTPRVDRRRGSPRIQPPVERGGGTEVADAGDDDPGRAWQVRRIARREQLGAAAVEPFAHRRQVARAVIDERDHSSPFVLGSIRARRRSRAHATRSARANALNTASTW